MSPAFELAVASYVLIRLHTVVRLDDVHQKWRVLMIASLALLCTVCWFVIVADAVRAAFR